MAQVKLFYPASFSHSEHESNTGQVAAQPFEHPLPVVIIMPGINVGSHAYQWLAESITKQAMVAVTYDLLAEEMPGQIGLTPGLDLNHITPSSYGTAPSASAIQPIINLLEQLNKDGVLKGLMDLNCVLLGGHSAGGTAALLNANPDWFPQVKGVFTYGAHSGASTALGFPPNTCLDIDGRLPILMLGGARDGCIARSKGRYEKASATIKNKNEPRKNDSITTENDATARLKQSFTQSFKEHHNNKHLIIVDGANHFSIVHPIDSTTGRFFIDLPTSRPGQYIRSCLEDLVTGFIKDCIASDTCDTPALTSQLDKHRALITSYLHR